MFVKEDSNLKVCKNLQSNGNCEIAGMACDKIFICSEDGLWIDKEDYDAYKSRN